MELLLKKYKGIHPGLILERELKKRDLKKGPFAISLQEYPQIFNEITKGRRGLTPGLSIKIDRALGLEEGTMFLLQAHYELKKEKEKNSYKEQPDLSILRKVLFWDADISKIDWKKQYKAIIKRVFERGNEDERKEIIRFYGTGKTKAVIGTDQFDQTIPIMSHAKIK